MPQALAARLTDLHKRGKLKPTIRKTVGKKKVGMVMDEFGKGNLHSGSKTGPAVTNRKQAVAIALSEGRKAARKGTTDKSKW